MFMQTQTGSSKIFINMAVKNLEKTKNFFTKLGYSFDPKFSDKNAICLVINEHIYAMLLLPHFLQKFIKKKEVIDSKKSTETILALSVESREKVDEMMEKVIGAGGREYKEPEDLGFMYGRSFEDLDGHLWEFFYMDESKK